MLLSKKSWDSQGRVCTVCLEYRTWDNFSAKNSKRYASRPNASLHQLKQPKCKICAVKETTSWRQDQSPERLKDLYYTRLYGISLEKFNKLFCDQNGKCPLCSKNLTLEGNNSNRAVVDHCHKTGKVRGILCNECNRGLGYFRDNPEALYKAASYLTGKLESEEGVCSCPL